MSEEKDTGEQEAECPHDENGGDFAVIVEEGEADGLVPPYREWMTSAALLLLCCLGGIPMMQIASQGFTLYAVVAVCTFIFGIHSLDKAGRLYAIKIKSLYMMLGDVSLAVLLGLQHDPQVQAMSPEEEKMVHEHIDTCKEMATDMAWSAFGKEARIVCIACVVINAMHWFARGF